MIYNKNNYQVRITFTVSSEFVFMEFSDMETYKIITIWSSLPAETQEEWNIIEYTRNMLWDNDFTL